MSLQPYQQRVVDEKAALDEKIGALMEFIEENGIFAGLPSDEQERLRFQLYYMTKYAKVLWERIEAFPK